MSKRRARSTAGFAALALGVAALAPDRASGDSSEEERLLEGESAAHTNVQRTPAEKLPTVSAETPLAPAPRSQYAIDIPTPLPPAVGVTAFANESGVRGLDWLGPAAGFIAGELISGHSGVRTLFGPLVVPAGAPPTTAAEVADFAGAHGVRFVVTGRFSRPDWELELRVELWEIERGTATRKGLAVNRGEFKQVHQFLSKSIISLFEQTDHGVSAEDSHLVVREPTSDFYAFTLFGRGLTRMLMPRTSRDWSSAKKNIERSLFIDPKFVEGHRVLAELYRRLHKSGMAKAPTKTKGGAMAISRLLRTLEARPEYAAATLALAQIREQRDQPEQARDLYAAVVTARPYDFEARYRLGKLLWDVGQAEDSYAVLSALIEHRPDDVRARRILVMIHSARGSGDALVAELEAVTKLDPNDEQTRMDLGAAYAAVDRLGDAIDVYRTIADNNARNITALKFLGDLHKKKGETTEAIKFYGLALSAAPWDPRPYFTLGAMYVEAGEDNKARRIYQRALRFRDYSSEVRSNLGGIAFRAGRIGDALGHHRKAVAENPRRARFRYNLALALSADGQLEDAAHEIGVGLRYDAGHVALNYLSGVVSLRRGDVEDASIRFEKTLELDPENKDARHNLSLIDELRRRADEGELIRERRH